MPDMVNVGAGVLIKVNSVVIGFATGITWVRNQGQKPFYEIDNIFPAEISPTGPYLVSGTLTGLRIVNSGGTDGANITNIADVNTLLTQQYVTLTLQDKNTGQNILNINRCMFDQDSYALEAKGQGTFSARFMGVWASNELSTDSAG